MSSRFVVFKLQVFNTSHFSLSSPFISALQSYQCLLMGTEQQLPTTDIHFLFPTKLLFTTLTQQPTHLGAAITGQGEMTREMIS